MKGPVTSSGHEVVGLEKHVMEVVVQLTGQDASRCRVVCIWGMGGIGKTTLAVQIYRQADIRSHFAGFAWAPLYDNLWKRSESKKLKIKIILKEILTQLTNDISDYEILVEKVLRTEEGKEYLVILDDIWSKVGMSLMKTLIYRFPNIKILLTTRNKGVISDLNESIFFHELRCLDGQQSWELFEKTANSTGHVRASEYEEMKELGEMMLHRCGGLPLAITLLGQLLSTAGTAYEWQNILFDKSVKTRKRGKKPKRKVELKSISRVLGSSYDDLPDYLRTCFLYLAHFPKECEIRVKELCRIWSAERYSSSGPSTVLDSVPSEEEAYGLIEELVGRCMVQVEKLDVHGRIKTLRIHNLMRQLCLVKAKEQGGILEIINSQNIHEEVDVLFYDELPDVVPTYKPRKIAIHLTKDVANELLPLIESVDRQDNLESLMCFNRLPHPSYEQVMKPLLKRFCMLRVLKFENISQGYIGNLPEEIGCLLHLRFLSLKGSHVEEVPSSIGNLVFLETLDLRTKWTLKLPNVIWKLERLRHLYLGHRSYISGNELRFGNPRNLQTLVNIPLMCCNVNDLMELSEVRNLKFYVHAKWWQNINAGSFEFDLLQSLAMENLSRAGVDFMPFISGCLQIEKLRLEGRIEKLLEDRYFPKLIKLTLSRTDLEDDPLMTLEKLPNLRFLLLNCNAFKGNAMVCSNGGFPRLESLSLVALEHLKEWRVENGALPSLRFLLIEYCYELEAIPDGLRYVTSLKKLVLKRMSREFQLKVEESGNDFSKVQHVPHIEFLDDEHPYCHSSNSSEYTLSTFRPAFTSHRTSYIGDFYNVPELHNVPGLYSIPEHRDVPEISPKFEANVPDQYYDISSTECEEIPDFNTKQEAGPYKEITRTFNKFEPKSRLLSIPKSWLVSIRNIIKWRKKRPEESKLQSVLQLKGEEGSSDTKTEKVKRRRWKGKK